MKGAVNTNVLQWALQRAGAKADALLVTHPEWDQLLAGQVVTINQIEALANKLYVPFGYLLLDSPPSEQLPAPYYRRGTLTTDVIDVNLYDALLYYKERQDWLSEDLKEEGEDPLPFVGRFNVNANAETIADDIMQTLQLPYDWAFGFSSKEKAISYISEQLVANEINIVFSSVVNNNTSRPIQLDLTRGFVLVDQYAPFLFVHSKDDPGAKLFTIFHELAHIWIGKSATLGPELEIDSAIDTERLCDQVAANCLANADLLRSAFKEHQEVEALSKKFKASQLMLKRRLLELSLISKDEFYNWFNEYQLRLSALGPANKKSTGGDFYKTLWKRLGKKLGQRVNYALSMGKISHMDAYRLTGLSGTTYHKLFKQS